MATALAIAVLSFSSAPQRVPTVAFQGEPPNADEQADVLILGAGMSGVAAAAVLHKAGVSFLIIEGTDRIGGRVKATQFAGKQIEEGANWIHGARSREGAGNVAHNNPLWDLAQQVGRPHSPDRSGIARPTSPPYTHLLALGRLGFQGHGPTMTTSSRTMASSDQTHLCPTRTFGGVPLSRRSCACTRSSSLWQMRRELLASALLRTSLCALACAR